MEIKTRPVSSQEQQKIAARMKRATWGDDFFYRALFEQSEDCIFIISFDLHYLAANPQALNLLGYTEAELIGKSMSEVVALEETPTDGSTPAESNLFERVLRCKNGSLVPVEISTSIVYDQSGGPVCIQSIARDISHRKEAERSIQQHNQILLALNEAATRLLQTHQIEQRSAEVLELLGRAADATACFLIEIRPRLIRILSEWQENNLRPISINPLITPFEKAILAQTTGIFAQDIGSHSAQSLAIIRIVDSPSQDTSIYLGLLYPKKVQDWLPAQADAVKIAANLIGAVLQRNQHEAALCASEERNRRLITALPDLIIHLAADGKILDYIARPDHPLYRPPQEVLGNLLSEIWPPEISEQILGWDEPGRSAGSYHLKEFQLPFGSQTYELRLSPLAAREALLVVRDVTEQTLLNQMKSDFINRASHELRTPLTTVILMANLIQEGGPPEEEREYWGVLNSELNRQKILIDRLLVAGRLESGTMKLELFPLDLIATLEESILAIKPMAGKKNISLVLNAPETALLVMGDQNGLQQVFINLINNAVKFSPPGASVEVNVSIEAQIVRTVIVDHGMGIPPEDLPHLCERFFRGKNVTLAEIPGSGIGLYIVKSIVQELGGTLEVESVLQKGTAIAVTFGRPA